MAAGDMGGGFEQAAVCDPGSGRGVGFEALAQVFGLAPEAGRDAQYLAQLLCDRRRVWKGHEHSFVVPTQPAVAPMWRAAGV